MKGGDRELKPPGQETDETKLVSFVVDRAYRSSPLYSEDFAVARKAELYDQSEQWLRKAHTTRDGRYPTQWIRLDHDTNDPNSIPLPVYNEMVALRENESARLGRPEYKPRVRAKGENPGTTEKEGAEGAERALISRLKQMPWEEEQEQLVYNMPMYGGSYLMSYWDQTWMDTVRVPDDSVICSRNPRAAGPPEAQQQMAPTPVQPMGMAEQVSSTTVGGFGPEGEVPPQTTVEASMQPIPQPPCDYVDTLAAAKQSTAPMPGSCPKCGSPLLPYQPTQQEAQGPLGKDWPKGDWKLKALKGPYGIFPRDAGVGVDRTDVDEWVYVHIERLDWLQERYPDKVRDVQTGLLRIHPEHPTSLMAENPTLGAPLVFQAAQHTAVFRDHLLVYEYAKRPWLAWNQELGKYVKNRGRYTVVAGKHVCLDTDLEIESLNQPGTFIPRVRLEFIPWEPKEGGRRATVGQSLWDRLFDAQDGINERMAQVRAVNQRGALPWYLQARGRNFETRAADQAVPFRRVQVDIDPTDRQPPLQLMQNTTIDSGVYAEIDQGQQYAQRVSGQVEVERGQVPPGVAAATAIAYLKTESGEKRRPRIRRIRSALIRAWEHGLRLMAGLYIEPREYSFEDEFGEERWAFIHGEVIAAANPKVDVYPTPDYDITDAQRESIRDMVQLGILNPSQTPQLNRKIVKALDPTLEMFVEDDLQEDQANREWRDFKDKGKVPVIDPSLDDPMTHYQLHGQASFSAWFRELEETGGWDDALAVLGSDWDENLMLLGMNKPPGTSLQMMILQFWVQRLNEAFMAGAFRPPKSNEALMKVLQWRAHTEAHKIRALIQQSGVQAPAQGSSPEPESEEAGGEVGGPPPGAEGPPPMEEAPPEGPVQ